MFGILFTQSLFLVKAGKPGTGSYEIELQYMDGAPISSYAWGEFNGKETKELECRLVNIGDNLAKITWKISNLPEGLEIEVWDQTRKRSKIWNKDDVLGLTPNKSLDLKIILRNIDAEPQLNLDFVLRFISMTPSQ